MTDDLFQDEVMPRVLEWLRQMHNVDDRLFIIVSASKIDELLTQLLKSKLIHDAADDRLFGHDRPLGTFSSRILLAFRLGVIDRQLERFLQALRKLRNDAAHAANTLNLTTSPHVDYIQTLVGCARQSPLWDNESIQLSTTELQRKTLFFCFTIAIVNLESAILQSKPFETDACTFLGVARTPRQTEDDPA